MGRGQGPGVVRLAARFCDFNFEPQIACKGSTPQLPTSTR